MRSDNEVVVFKLSITERLELDEALRKLGFSTKKSFFVDVIRGVLTALDGKDRGSLFVYVPIPRTLVQDLLDNGVQIQAEVIKKLMNS